MTDGRIHGPTRPTAELAVERLTPLPPNGRLLAIDLGEKRIGLACSDPTQTVAHPLTTVTRRSGKRFPLGALKSYLDAHQPVGIVIGLPLTPAGSEGARAAEARSVGALITERTGLPVAYWDERMTTARVLSAMKELGDKPPRRGERVDHLAATIILQTVLDARQR